MTVLFISDLHLDAGRPETLARFDEFIERRALGAREVYVLGDLFEAWIGDDDDDRRLQPVIAGLRRLTRAGIPAAVMHGNRDFLLGQDFCEATGCRLLEEYERVDIYGATVLLTHGDLLCTDDIRYMTLRATLRNAAWQREFLAKSLSERRAIAADLRKLSATEIAAKPEDIMDVNQTAVEETMRRFDVRFLLHGHTHRPGVHRFSLDGQAATRIVLGAWHERGSVVTWDATGFRLEQL
jgi:UDP-2,3-diacylglucosamine hydrolase